MLEEEVFKRGEEGKRRGKGVVDGGSSWHSKRRRAGDGLVVKRETTREGRKNQDDHID